MFDLENEDQRHGVQHSQRSPQTANIVLYKNSYLNIIANSHHFRDIHISKFVTLKMLVKVITYNIRSGAIRWQIPDFISDNICHVCSNFHRLRGFSKWRKMPKLLPWKFRSRSLSTTFEMFPFDGKYQPLWKSNLNIFRWLSLFFLDIHISKFVTENIGQGHDVQHSRWRHSMANTWLPIWWQ